MPRTSCCLMLSRACLLMILLPGILEAQEAVRPHIVLIYADDMGYGDLGVQNPDSRIPTPHLDRLAAQGLRCTDAHSSSGVCTPSRYALLTGRYHWRKFHGIVNSFEPPVLSDEELTLAEMLKSAGYRTACIGKWHLGWDWEAIRRRGAEPRLAEGGRKPGFAADAFDWSRPIPGGPRAHGFDTYFGDDVPNFPPYAWFEDDRLITPPTRDLEITQQTAEGGWECRPGPMVDGWDFMAVSPRLADRAVEWIAGQQGTREPFFLYLPLNGPHAPMLPTPEFRGRSQAGGYGDYMMQMDHHVGRVLQALDDHGLADQTLVVFTSDNGPETYAYERMRTSGHQSAGPLRGLKRDLYEGGHRVPFLVRWPGRVAAGRVSEELVGQMDLFATVAAIIGAKLPASAADDSYNLLPVWLGDAPSPRRSIVHNTFANAYAMRHEQWVLIDAASGYHSGVPDWYKERYNEREDGLPGGLYNLHEDLSQRRNQFAERPELVAEMKQMLQRIRATGQARNATRGG